MHYADVMHKTFKRSMKSFLKKKMEEEEEDMIIKRP